MLSQQMQAEAVDGGDLGILNQNRLLLQIFIIRLFRQLLFNGVKNPLSHLGGSGFRKCHHKKSLYISRMLLVCNHLNNTLHKNGRLPASRCGGY